MIFKFSVLSTIAKIILAVYDNCVAKYSTKRACKSLKVFGRSFFVAIPPL